jgi:hypothetical protein
MRPRFQIWPHVFKLQAYPRGEFDNEVNLLRRRLASALGSHSTFNPPLWKHVRMNPHDSK